MYALEYKVLYIVKTELTKESDLSIIPLETGCNLRGTQAAG